MKLQGKLVLVMGGAAVLVGIAILGLSLLSLNETMSSIAQIRKKSTLEAFRNDAENNILTEAELLKRVTAITFSLVDNYEPVTSANREARSQFLRSRFMLMHDTDIVLAGVMSISDKQPELVTHLSFGYSKTGSFVYNIPPRIEPQSSLARFIADPENQNRTSYLVYEQHLWLVHTVRHHTGHDVTFYAFRLNSGFVGNTLFMADNSACYITTGRTVLSRASRSHNLLESVTPEMREELLRIANSIPARKEPFTILIEPQPGRSFLVAALRLDVPVYDKAPLVLLKLIPDHHTVLPADQDIGGRIKRMFTSILIISFMGLLVFLFPLFFFARTISRPITCAVAFADTLANGEFPPQAVYHGRIMEIAMLIKALNHMRDRLNNMFAKLKRSHEREFEARRDAENANHLKSDFLASMSAELRNPVSAIQGFSSLLLHDVKVCDQIQCSELAAPLQTIQLNAVKMNDSVDALLDLSLLDASSEKPDISEFDTTAMLTELTNKAYRLAEERSNASVVIENHYTSDIPAVIRTDKKMLFAALSQIVAALVKTAPQNSRISFGCSKVRKMISFWVDSTGGDSLATEFIRYSVPGQTRPLSSFVMAPAILKLSIAKNCAHLIGAEFEAVDSSENFLFRINFVASDILPLSESTSSMIHSANNWSPNTRHNMSNTNTRINLIDFIRQTRGSKKSRLNVLLAEDTEENRMIVKMMLKGQNCAIDNVSTQQECLDALSSKFYHVFILNVQMSALDVPDILSQIRADSRHESMLVIAMMTCLEEGDKETLMSQGVDKCLLKPLNMEELVGAVRELTP